MWSGFHPELQMYSEPLVLWMLPEDKQRSNCPPITKENRAWQARTVSKKTVVSTRDFDNLSSFLGDDKYFRLGPKAILDESKVASILKPLIVGHFPTEPNQVPQWYSLLDQQVQRHYVRERITDNL